MANHPVLRNWSLGEIRQNNGHYAVQGHSRSPILSKAHMRLPISD